MRRILCVIALAGCDASSPANDPPASTFDPASPTGPYDGALRAQLALIELAGDTHWGDPIMYEVWGAAPGETVYLLFSKAGEGPGPCSEIIGGQCLDIRDPVKLLSSVPADARGIATFSFTLPDPGPMPQLMVGLQAAVIRGLGGVDSLLSNPITSVFTDPVCAYPVEDVAPLALSAQTISPMYVGLHFQGDIVANQIHDYTPGPCADCLNVINTSSATVTFELFDSDGGFLTSVCSVEYDLSYASVTPSSMVTENGLPLYAAFKVDLSTPEAKAHVHPHQGEAFYDTKCKRLDATTISKLDWNGVTPTSDIRDWIGAWEWEFGYGQMDERYIITPGGGNVWTILVDSQDDFYTEWYPHLGALYNTVPHLNAFEAYESGYFIAYEHDCEEWPRLGRDEGPMQNDFIEAPKPNAGPLDGAFKSNTVFVFPIY